MHDISFFLKIAAIAILLFSSSTLFIAGRFSARALASGLFTLSIAGYLGCQIFHGSSVSEWFLWFVHLGCFVAPLTFYLLTESLFEDKFRFRWHHLALFVFIEAVNFYLIIYLRVYAADGHLQYGDFLTLLRALPQTVSLVFILVALGKTLLKRKADLIESRRNFRIKFIAITSAYMLLVLISELAYQGQHAPPMLDLLHSAGILATVWYFASKMFTVRSGTLGEVNTIVTKSTAIPERETVNQELLSKLEKAMDTGKIYTQESLSIRELAKFLETQEYILRRLINAGLGYRNFNDYLNELRITAAARILADKEQASTPIIRIAMDLGFGSLAPFNKAFRERKGMTPTEFRKKSA
ncbi:helix-turn-helix transcriptional regulator [Turneriella parva]|uniref:Transcriptional regulator, AraC family n=1 Tax=Turneriella parva (strain ATCC BAA-1111 / DSM 21527 / NCTC 11395 / H) TaxID=869212 RepID=I4B9X4_TURPD|nr:AraC family transcriptional regulator [Turneriella parva]AFM14081.1 transcriptional regulator, AraC family [Turneriella parva DSM 21527]